MRPDQHRDAAWDAFVRAKDYPVTGDPRTAFLLEALFHATLAGPVPPVDVIEVFEAGSEDPVLTIPAPVIPEPAPAAPRRRAAKKST